MYTAASPAGKRVAESLSTKPNVVIVIPQRVKLPIVIAKTVVDTVKVNLVKKTWMIRLLGRRKLCNQRVCVRLFRPGNAIFVVD